mgnify:CR=1 FL=1
MEIPYTDKELAEMEAEQQEYDERTRDETDKYYGNLATGEDMAVEELNA